MYQIGFVIEQALGHITHGKNLQENLRRDPTVTAHWSLPAWEVRGWAAKVPLYRSNWTVRAGLRARRQVAQIARKTQLDALFFHTQVTAVLAQDWLDRIPSIVSLDATPLQYDRLGEFYGHEVGSGWVEKLKWRMNRDCYQKARKLVTWSEWTKQGLVDEYEVPPEKVTVIPPGVNSQDWARPQPRVPHDGPVKILFVGGNLERKGGTLLLKAFRTLRSEMSARQGGAELRLELHLATKDTLPPEPGVYVYNNMEPNSPELKQLYHDCDIFCLPTQGDCLPMVLSEASAAGLPVVSTRLAAIPEIVKEGKTGMLITPGSQVDLTEALRCLVNNEQLRLQMGMEGVRVVTNGYDAVKNTSRLISLIKETVDEDRQAGRKR